MRKVVIAVLMVCLSSLGSVAWGKVVGRTVTYSAGDVKLQGYLAEDKTIKAAGGKPAVLVVHEWWGLNEYARKRARMLAKQGYVAMAVDMFGNGKTAAHPQEAGKFAGELTKNRELAERRFDAALDFIRKQPSVDGRRIAAIGYCFGGGIVLQMARQGKDLKGVVSYHGTLATDAPARQGEVKAKILVFNGEADKMVPPEQVTAFKEEMEKAGAPYRYVGYPGAQHSFTNPDAGRLAKQFDLPLAYDAKADLDSWGQTLTFLREIFQKGGASSSK